VLQDVLVTFPCLGRIVGIGASFISHSSHWLGCR
jgi:hypothetical protein